jgi:hypothetical protein
MAAPPNQQRRSGPWRLAAAAALIGVCQIPPTTVLAEEPAIYVEEPNEGDSASVDIAVALSEDPEQDTAEYAAYTQPPAPVEEGATLEEVAPSVAEPAIASTEEPTEEQADEGATAERPFFRPITEVSADARLPDGLLPEQVGREDGDIEPAPETPNIGDPRLVSGWSRNAFEWSATKLCHGPLYFEEVSLERYGYQCHPAVQPLVSGAHFFLTVPMLPYQMTVHPPRECIYTLGHYRPGSRVPWQRHYLPWDARAAAVQAGVTVGLIALIP